MAAGALVSAGALLVGATGASANTIGVAPQWFPANYNGVNTIRSSGSETTYYLMARLGDLYTQTSIYGCTLSTDNKTCNGGGNNDSTDTTDDWARTEYTNGAGIGTGGGIKQMCQIGGGNLSGAPTVDFARASRTAKTSENGGLCPKPGTPVTNNGVSYSNPVDLAYADDSVPGLDFQFQGSTTMAGSPATQLGPVSAGWKPGDPFGGPYTNNAVSSIDHNETTPGGGITTSLAYRIWCSNAVNSATSPFLNRISDWGQLTDPTVDSGKTLTYTNSHGVVTTFTPTKGQEGLGAPIGIPIYVPKVNPSSGTKGTWDGFTGCSDSNTNADGGNLVQENDGPQFQLIGAKGGTGTGSTGTYMANNESPAVLTGSTPALQSTEASYFSTSSAAGDPVYQNNLVAAAVYYISYGVSVWHPYTAGGGTRTSIDHVAASQTNENKTNCGAGCYLINSARQLHNYVNPGVIRASTLGFMNWICDTDAAQLNHGLDLTTGLNYNAELNNTIGVQFWFPREDCSTASFALTPTDPNS